MQAQCLSHSLFVPEGKGWGKEITCCLTIKHKNTSRAKVPFYTQILSWCNRSDSDYIPSVLQHPERLEYNGIQAKKKVSV